jgi:fructokinase
MTHSRQTQPLVFGEVLFDQFPDGSVVLGGAPFNVACHLQAFDQKPLFVSRVGDDPLGRQIRRVMQDWDMDTAGLQKDSAHPTGTVAVRIANDEPSFEIRDQCAYDFVSADALPPLGPCPLLYHGSLALRSGPNRHTLRRLVEISAAPVFVDVNLRPPWWERNRVMEMLRAARWAKLNEQELGELAPTGDDLLARCASLQDTAGLDLLVVTLGAAGALARSAEGRVAQVAPGKSVNIVDTVGAGDAFSSVILLGLLRGWDTRDTLQRAQAFASAVVGIRGATPSQRNFYRPFLEQWL